MEHFSSLRWFSLHDYFPTFHLLLLRSRPVTQADEHVIDIIFGGVFYVELYADLHGVSISETTDAEIERLDKRAGQPQRYEANRYFVLTSNDQRYYVGAFGYHIEENNLGFRETSLGATFAEPETYERTIRVKCPEELYLGL